MRTVNRFESNLLRILQGLVGQAKRNQVIRLLERSQRWPDCLSRDAVDLIQDSLSKGIVTLLTRLGAWQRQRHLRGDAVCEGALWHRSSPDSLGLVFTPTSLDFLIWLTATDVSDTTKLWLPTDREDTDASRQADGSVERDGNGESKLESGDEFLLFLAARMMQGTPTLESWLNGEAMIHHPLMALAMPNQFATARVMPEPDFDAWMTGTRSLLLEALQEELAQNWVKIERTKAEITGIREMVRLGTTQERVLKALLDAAERHGRRDLCRFVVVALTRLATPGCDRAQWIGSLSTTGKRISQRTDAYQGASAFLRVNARLRNWQQASAGVGFFDEGYAESQLWKTLWEESHAEAAMSEANRVVSTMQY